MIVAFKKQSSSWIDRIIQYITDGPYFHCELIFDQLSTNPADSKNWESFSSSMSDGGTRFTYLDYDENNSNEWTVVTISNITKLKEMDCYHWCHSQLNRNYDYWGILRFLIPFVKIKIGRNWFCSEICLAALQSIGLYEDLTPYLYSPNDLFNLLSLDNM